MPKLKEEQARAVFHDDGNILVSASAGSGKTFVMIERLIRLIAEGKAGVKQILAVTFTEMAASEMKEKLKNALIEKINQTGDKRLIKELQEIPTADISTLHAFCARLIRTYFYAVGVAPDFKILDDAEAGAIKHDSMDKAFNHFYQAGEDWFKKVVARHLENRSDSTLKATLIIMCDAGRVNADGDIYLKQAQKIYSEEGLNALLVEYKQRVNAKIASLIDSVSYALKIFTAQQKPKVVEFITTLITDMEKVLSNPDVYCMLQYENYKLDLPKGVRFSGELNVIYKKLAVLRDEFKQIIKESCDGLNGREKDFSTLVQEREHILSLFKIIEKYQEIYELAKREENGLDFNDLEHFALDVLADEQIKKEVKNKYKYLFVDEYQDTNGAQEAIISKIADNNLFMVGDAKQSIYGFRGCRPEIFLGKLEKMSARGEKTVLLNHNFRSSDKVIELINKVFSYSMTKEYFGMEYKDTSILKAGGVYGEKYGGRVHLHLAKKPTNKPKEFESPRIYDILQEIDKPLEGDQAITPNLIARIIEDELKKEFYDPKSGKMRPVKYGDICVLTRNKDNKYVRDIVKTLVGYGIPVVSVVKENVCDHPEIRQLIDAVKLLDCFNQDIPLAGVLKSAIGNFTDEELAEIVIKFNDDNQEGTFFDAFNYYLRVEQNPLQQRLKEFYEYFNKIRVISDFTGAFGGLKRIVKDKNIEQNLFAQPFGKLKVKRLNKFISSGVIDGKPLSVKEFLERVELYPSSFGFADGAEENSVKLMTIHASKGLEFPVVIVCGLERHANAREERYEIMFDQDLGFAVKSYNDKERTQRETPFRMVLRSRMRDNRLKEELRLFYVALTRAAYSLHLTFSGSKDTRVEEFRGAKRFLDYLPKDIELTEHSAEELYRANQTDSVKTVLIGEPKEELALEMKKSLAYQYPFMQDTVLPLKNSVTKATHALTEDTPPVHVLFDGDITPDTERGNIAHKIMEFYDFKSSKPLIDQVELLIKDGVVSLEQVKKIDLSRLEKALTSPVFELVKDMTLYREKDFIVSAEASLVFGSTSSEQVLLQGVIDLLAVDKDKAIIIDYKYSSLEKESLKARYALQLELYAYALEKATGIKTQNKILVNLFTGDTVTL